MRKTAMTFLCIAAVLAGTAYAKPDHHKELPYGLQKKAAKGKQLPPGWQKKLRKGARIEREVYQHARIIEPVDAKGIVTIKIDEKVVRLVKATHEIVDILK
jgi:hypothetical protein